ncbi:MAG: hypothetical protein ACR2M1_07680 [Gemmatimonadaceae bacterium]
MADIPSFLGAQNLGHSSDVQGTPDDAAAETSARVQYTRYATMEECPRCFMGTRGEVVCPTCGMDMSDANIAAEEAVRGQNLQRRGRALSYVLLAAAVFALTAPLFYSMGRRSVTVAEDVRQTNLTAAAQQVWRGLDENTRLALKSRDYMTVLNPDVAGQVAQVSFVSIPIAGQPPVPGTRDLSLLLTDDKAWQNAPADVRLITIAALAKYHQMFLTDAGYSDSTHFAVQLVAPDGRGGLRRLARRDRTGHVDVTGVASVSDSTQSAH